MNKFRSKYFYSVFLGFLGFACCTAQADDYGCLFDKLSAKFAKEVTEQYGLLYKGCCGELMEDIKTVDLEFKSYDLCSIDEIRPLIVELSERYLFIINHNERIRPYLHTYPLTPMQLSLLLDFVDRNDGLYPDPPNIAFALYVKGKIYYYINRRGPSGWKSFSPNYEQIYEETIEEATKVVGKEPNIGMIKWCTLS